MSDFQITVLEPRISNISRLKYLSWINNGEITYAPTLTPDFVDALIKEISELESN